MSEMIKVFELAKALDLKALELIERIKPLDLKIKNHMAELSPEQVETIKNFLNPPATGEPEKKKILVRKKKVTDEAESLEKKASSVMIKKAGIIVKKDSPGLGLNADSSSAMESEENTDAGSVMSASVNSASVNLASVNLATEEPLEAPVASDSALEGQATLQEFGGSNTLVESTEAQGIVSDTVPSPGLQNLSEVVEVASGPEEGPAVVAPVRRGNRYSIIRVVSPATGEGTKPRIIEEAPAGGIAQPRNKASVPKTFADPELARSASALIREIEAEEELKRKKSGAASRTRSQGEDLSSFKSTDYLRRERVYQPKKKKISIGGRLGSKPQQAPSLNHKRTVEFEGDSISVENLAEQMAIKSRDLIRKLAELGVEQPDDLEHLTDWELDFDTAAVVVEAFENDIRDVNFNEAEIIEAASGSKEADADIPSRSPVVTIMGHVDHGKTSLLDVIRKARVAAGEAGGITQHIGAYVVDVAEAVKNLQNPNIAGKKSESKADAKAAAPKAKTKDKAKPAKESKLTISQLTFLDTPGHAAFSSMRSRGAKVTDIVVLVVSAVDGVMPQTREAIDHARAAGVPIIVAVNKIDLPESNVDKIKKQLGDLNIIPEDWGGENIFVHVSAKTGEGVDKLLEMIQVQAEVLQLKAPVEGPAEGAIIEAKLDKGRGPVASVLVKRGTLRVGEYIVAGTQFGRIRALINDKGVQVKTATPSTPVEILGLGGVPEAGDALNAVADERSARALSEHRVDQKKEGYSAPKTFSVEDLMSRMSAGEQKELPVILKTDVRGSAEAIQAALSKVTSDKVRLKILSVAVGAISESDVLLASASKALVLGFNVRPDNKAQSEAERRGVVVRTFTIIYELIDEVTKMMEGLLAPTLKETVMGRAEVRNVFSITKVGAVAGCNVVKGKIQRNNQVRLLRDGRVIYTGKMSGLKRFKDDAKEVAEGFECGISIENYQDVKVGDLIEAFLIEESVTRLSPSATP